MRATSIICNIVAFLGVAHATFDKCDRPVAQWAGLNQAEGNGGIYTAKYHDGSVYIGGYQDGEYSFHSQHLTTGPTGTHGDDHTAVNVQHDAATHTDPDENGVMTPVPSSQNGRDAVITKISDGGVYEGIFAVDTLPVDGKYDDTSLNSGWGGWSWFSDIDDFAESGETDTMVASGVFRGKLTFPAEGDTDEVKNVVLKNSKWQKYDGFITKFNVKTHKVVWATAEVIQKPSCNTNTDGTPMKSKKDGGCDEPTTLPGAVATTSAGHVVTTSNWGLSGRYTNQGRILLFNGQTGANVWEEDYGVGNMVYGVATIGEAAYVTGCIKGVDIDPFKTGTKVTTGTTTSSKSGEVSEESAAAIAAVGATAGNQIGDTKWAINFGIGCASSIVAKGIHLYVGGKLDPAADATTGATDGKYIINNACSLTGENGGFLVKLVAETGECLWAADTPEVGRADSRFGFRNHGLDVDAAGAYVYIVKSDDEPMKFDASHTVPNAGREYDGFLAKYDAVDGAGQWIQPIGGAGSDTLTEVVTTPNGVVVAGYSKSSEVSLGSVTIVNLQHKRSGTTGASGGHQAHFAMLIHAEERLSCIKDCTDGNINRVASTGLADLKANFCFIENTYTCISQDVFPKDSPCLQCKPDVSTDQLQFTSTDHCYIDSTCVAEGAGAPNYQRYGVSSVCEVCDPVKDNKGWNVKKGFFHERRSANERSHGRSNDWGIYFPIGGSNGCQVLPDIKMPTVQKDGLTMALASTIADIGARATSAISAVIGADGSNQGVETAWAWYLGNTATCTLSTFSKSGDVCNLTPGASSDALADEFETNLHYGHSIARVKVQQGLGVLQNDLVTPSTDRTVADLKTDIVAHMLIPFYQGAIKAAHLMDQGPNKEAAQADGAAHWKVIDQAIQGDGIRPSDRAHLTALFASSASGNMNFCTVQMLLLRNLPPDTELQYSSKPWAEGQIMGDRARAIPCSGNCGQVNVVQHTKDDAVRHVTVADVGVLLASRVGTEEKTCTEFAMPPPAPPPPAPPPPPATTVAALEELLKDSKTKLQNSDLTPEARAALEAELKKAQEDLEAAKAKLGAKEDSSGLTEGEVAGIAIGAAIGGILLLVIVGLILRSLLFKEAKPVFTCLEKAPAEKKAPV